VSGLEKLNKSAPIELSETGLLLTIARSARVARFIRSMAAVKISRRINWFALLNLVNPMWYYKKLVRPKDEAVSPDGVRNGPGTKLRNSLGKKKSRKNDVGLMALAAVKAGNTTETSGRLPLVEIALAVLKSVGLVRITNEEFRRHLAASRIQRAWRRVLEQNKLAMEKDAQVAGGGHEMEGLELARGRGGHVRSFTGNLERPKMSRFSSQRSQLSHTSGSRHLVSKDFSDDDGESFCEGDGMGQYTSSSNRSIRGPSRLVKNRNESQVGSAMRELTGRRVAIGIIIALVLTVLFTYLEVDSTRAATMIVLFGQTRNPTFAMRALDAARTSVIPTLYEYRYANGAIEKFDIGVDVSTLRARETQVINITGADGSFTVGTFSHKEEAEEGAIVSLISTIFILLIWFFGVTAFSGPVMILVVIPIERMVRLLNMLMVDPLGYQNTSRYRRFVAEEDQITKNTRWTKEVLKGMETSFLMSTILRIGSLMKVGFGSAGVEIIRSNLEKGQSKNMLLLDSRGSTVFCIFLFSDIRSFTDATECLQEEVFLFTNRIAAVIHSICHSYGGAANKNVGDAFLLSWLLDTEESPVGGRAARNFTAKKNQVRVVGFAHLDLWRLSLTMLFLQKADKALLSVIKIIMALQFDDYYTEPMSPGAREALLKKFSHRKGPVVQMGFGLHAGEAVEGAIGSQRKIDATYVSEEVERAEFLESSTKKYGVKLLMSDAFFRLLHPSNRRRCRQVDRILLVDEDAGDDENVDPELLKLYTFDTDVEALWRRPTKSENGNDDETESGTDKQPGSRVLSSVAAAAGLRRRNPGAREKGDESSMEFGASGRSGLEEPEDAWEPPQLVLPSGYARYNAGVWFSDDMRRIRQKYSDARFSQQFASGFDAYFEKDWTTARREFESILRQFEDGPSRYFIDQMKKYDYRCPGTFPGYHTA
jgi:class 3 adenylate cyclase